MATEKLNFDTYDSGWETGAIADVDEAISGADGAAIGTATKNQVALMGLSASAVVDADTVTGITVVVRARTTGSANDALGVELLIGGVVQGARQDSVSLTASFVNYTFNDVAWDADRTEAEMDGMQIRLHSRQSGMPGATGHEVDCADVDVAFDPPGGGETASGDGPVPAIVAAGVAKVHRAASGAATLAAVAAAGTASVGAFGSLVKSDFVANISLATFSPDLGSNPASGNLLIATVCAGSSTALLSTPPSGFTLLHASTTGSGTWYWYYKISVGNEQTISAIWDASINGVMRYVEYEWDGSTPSVTKNENTDNISSNTNSQPSGAATPTDATNICMAMHATDGNSDSFVGQAVDGSWIEDFAFLNNDAQQAEGKLSRLVNAALSSQEATHTDTDTGDQMYGAIAIFNIGGGETASGDGAVPAIEAAGVAKVHRAASGSAEIGAVEAAGTANVGGAHTASGDGPLPVIEAAGVAKVHRAASGGGTLGAVVAAGTATVHRAASGSALLAAVIAAGNATVHRAASGAASIASVEAAGSATVGAVEVASGDGPLPAIEAAGVAKLHRAATGSAAIAAIEAAGTATVHRVASGAAFIGAIVANGLAKVVKLASGAATMAAVSASGVAVAGGATIASSVELDARILDISLDAQQITPNLDAKI